MGKVLKHPLRAMGAALTIVGAGIVFVVFFIPMATAGPSRRATERVQVPRVRMRSMRT